MNDLPDNLLGLHGLHYLYRDAEKSFRGKVATRWQWNAGVRYDF